MNKQESSIIIYNTADGKSKVSHFAKDGSVWMSQSQLAELFAISKQNIGQHISNVLEENELQENSVVKNYFTTAADGKEYDVESEDKKMKKNWIYISLFIILSVALSAPVHLGYVDAFYLSITNGTILSDWVYLLAGFGPFLAGVLFLALNKNLSNKITIFGNHKIKNILIAILPVISFTIIGLENTKGIDYHLYAFIYTSINVLYAFLEEFGWRRYLQNALDGINKNLKYLLIGVIWWLWHLRFTTDFDIFIFPLICIGGGYLLGKLADDTKSILPIVSMHTLVIILTNSGPMTTNKIIGVILTILGWFLVEKFMKENNE